jgi:hypothetical protein
MNAVTSPVDALADLLEERRRYEIWLQQLEERGSNAPPHVVERVRLDYTRRLENVTSQLRARAGELESSARELAARVEKLLADEKTQRDERAEAELRGAVGEYSPEQTQELLARCDEAIARLAAERAVMAAELAKVEEILVSIGRAQTKQGGQAKVPEAAERPPLPSGEEAAAAIDELAFLDSVTESVAVGRARSSDVPTPRATSTPAAPGNEARRPDFSRAPAFEAPHSTPSFLKEPAGEQAKTLRCQECGTMNYPTEWYCERCGGELAAL